MVAPQQANISNPAFQIDGNVLADSPTSSSGLNEDLMMMLCKLAKMKSLQTKLMAQGRNKRVWTKEENTMLVDSLMELHVSGKYVNADIEPEYVNAVLELMDPNVVYSAKPVRNRMKLMKTHFYTVHDMLVGKHMSGFSWDPQNSCVVADNQVWDEYIKKKTKCVESKDLHVGEDVGSTHGVFEGVSSKRKRDEGKDPSETCVESLKKLKNIIESFVRSFVVNLETSANDMMDIVMTQMGDLSGLTLDERLIAMS
ncbi:hypothetical protein L1987_02591 [Smallanthus sonchifolius]|uniref:Uncharacterized protein n=1 Tax=Smallanthus sonchifolius TaxID=185202 RepID=A0ACB9K8F2_9ASTR|nr:hypothetical protein L1987_02591 [Smallanthus sonchifolius]